MTYTFFLVRSMWLCGKCFVLNPPQQETCACGASRDSGMQFTIAMITYSFPPIFWYQLFRPMQTLGKLELYYSRTRIIADCILLYINKDQIIADYINRTKIIADCISLSINITKISTDYADRTNMIADCISLYADRTKMITDCISLYADRTKMIVDCISVWKDSLNSDCQQRRQNQNITNNHLSPQKIAHKKHKIRQ